MDDFMLLDAPLEHHFKFSAEKRNQQVSGLDGIALNAMDVARLCYQAGWIDATLLADALATFCSESLFHVRAFHHNIDADGNVVSTDWGPCQLNDKAHPGLFPNGDESVVACNPDRCFDAAYDIWTSAGHSFNPWFGWKNQVALDDYYLRRASLGVMNFIGRDLVTLAEARPGVVAGRVTPATNTRVPVVTLKEFRTIYPPGS